ncbi:MAG: tetratricopeptide repeat protein [Planctomycetaceae bacterium]|nr:tetratricopeptide repeat protein [Planctomycetaceae bacterium]
MWGQKKLDEAITAYRKAIELDPKSADAVAMGDFNGDGRWDMAAADY